MNKREQITQLIETYIKDYCPKDKHILTAGEIRKWPEISVFSSNKIITPQLQNNSNFTVDDGTYYPDAGGYMLKLKKYNEVDFYYCLGILNSSLFYHFIKTTSTVFNNDYYYFKSAYIEPFHFPQVSEDNKKYISNIAKTIIDMHKKDNSDTYELETKINRKVFEIYGLTPE